MILHNTAIRSIQCLKTATTKTTVIRSTARRCLSTLPASSPWSSFPMAPPDPILGLSEAFAKDDYPQKVILGVGAYRGDDGKPLVLQCVRDAEEIIMGQKLDHEYAGIVGEPKFISHALKFAYGDSSAPLIENRVAGVQTLSGTGGLRVFGELVAKFGHKHIYVPNPTWGNHIPIFTNAGLEVRKYRYYDSKLSSLDFDNMLKDLEDMPKGSIVLLHACAHNPTGMDPTLEQWSTISQICKTRSLLPFFDCAYQCFASGDADQDAQAIRLFVSDGHQIALVQSFSKNFGLYGQRVGALSVIGADEDEAKRVLSQMKIVIRPMYSNPPRHGARIVSAILEDARLRGDFVSQCRGMADRINVMRGELRGGLERAGSNKNWEHVTKQIGMFAYSGLSKEECELLRDKHHVYLTLDGRISMAGVTTANVDYIANAIHDVTK